MTEIGMDVATDVLGVFTTRGAAKRFMIEIAHNFYLCPKLMGFEKGKGRCFRQQLDRCFGACSLDEPALTYNARFDQAFINTSVDEWPFDGPVEVVEESGNLTEIIKIYRWCVTERQVGGETQQSEGKVFDLDTYRIIRSYFRSGKATIGPVTS